MFNNQQLGRLTEQINKDRRASQRMNKPLFDKCRKMLAKKALLRQEEDEDDPWDVRDWSSKPSGQSVMWIGLNVDPRKARMMRALGVEQKPLGGEPDWSVPADDELAPRLADTACGVLPPGSASGTGVCGVDGKRERQLLKSALQRDAELRPRPQSAQMSRGSASTGSRRPSSALPRTSSEPSLQYELAPGQGHDLEAWLEAAIDAESSVPSGSRRPQSAAVSRSASTGSLPSRPRSAHPASRPSTASRPPSACSSRPYSAKERPMTASTQASGMSELSRCTMDLLDEEEDELLPSWDEPEPRPRPETALSRPSTSATRSSSCSALDYDRPVAARPSSRASQRASSAPQKPPPRKPKVSAAVNFLSQTKHHTKNPYTTGGTTKIVDLGDRWAGITNDTCKGTKRRDLLTWGVSKEGEGRAAYLRSSYSRCPQKRYVTPVTVAQEIGFSLGLAGEKAMLQLHPARQERSGVKHFFRNTSITGMRRFENVRVEPPFVPL